MALYCLLVKFLILQLRMSTDIKRLKRYAGSQARLAAILGLTPEHVSRMMTGAREVPEYITVIADLMDKLPPEHWPARWREKA